MLSLKHCVQVFVRRHVRLLCTSVTEPLKVDIVMGREVLEYIQPTKEAVIVDMTFGTGRHTELILKSDPSVKVLALDRDQVSYDLAKSLSAEYRDRLIPLHGKFSELPNLIEPLGYGKGSIDAMLFDCGCSDLQMENAKRGFSHKVDGPLDMRMNVTGINVDNITASEVLQCANEIDLKNIFKLYGLLSSGKKIARAILHTRHTHAEIKTTSDLAQLLVNHCDLSNQEVLSAFRALRYFINDELNQLSHGVYLAEWYLKNGGRLLSISECQIDDSIIKNHITGTVSSNFVGLPMEFTSFTAPHSNDSIAKKSCWSKINKHVIIPEGDKLLAKTRKLRAVVKQQSNVQW